MDTLTVTIEGPRGVGKTLIARHLIEHYGEILHKQPKQVTVIRDILETSNATMPAPAKSDDPDTLTLHIIEVTTDD